MSLGLSLVLIYHMIMRATDLDIVIWVQETVDICYVESVQISLLLIAVNLCE